MASTLTKQQAKTLVLVSIAAAALGCIADILILYHPDAVYERGDYQFLLSISESRLLIGSMMGVFAIPIYLCGIYVVIMKNIKCPFRGFIVFMCCVMIAVIGCVYHGMIAMVGYVLKSADNPITEIAKVRIYFDPYAAVMVITFFVGCMAFGYLMYVKKQWTLMMSNPLSTYFICVLCYVAVPSLGRILLPAAFNLSVCVFMVAFYITLCDDNQFVKKKGR